RAPGPADRARTRARLSQARAVGVPVQQGRGGALRTPRGPDRRHLPRGGSARRPVGRHHHHGEAPVKILYTPLMIVPALDDTDRKNILEAAGPQSTLIDAKDPAGQRKEIGDTEALFGRVANDLFVTAKRLRYYPSIGAGVDAILTPELVNSDVILASEKGEVGIHLAEHAFALLLTITRGIHTALRKPDYSLREPIRKEQWELHDQTLGIVGFGGTGRALAPGARGVGTQGAGGGTQGPHGLG